MEPDTFLIFGHFGCLPMAENEANIHHQRAIRTRAFPLFRFDPQKSQYFTECIDLSGNPNLESDWFKSPEKNNAVTFADWAVYEKEYRFEFFTISKGDWQDNLIPLHEYLQLDAEKKKLHRPYITVTDVKDQKHFVGISDRMIKLAGQSLKNWRLLQELAGIKSYDKAYIESKWQARLEDALTNQKSDLEAEYNAQLAQVQNEHWQIYHSRLKDKLKALYKSRKEEGSPEQTLAEYAKRKN